MSPDDHGLSSDRPSFGELVRYYRRQSTDPMRGGFLTQERLGELIGDEMGDAGYTGAAVSEWERSKSKIHADDRLVLVSLLGVLLRCGGICSVEQANELLAAGNYRRLDRVEQPKLFEQPLAGDDIGESSSRESAARRAKQLILAEKVHSFWVEGVLEKSLLGAPMITVPWQQCQEAVCHPWREQLGEALFAAPESEAQTSIAETFRKADEALLILGDPGSGKSTALIRLAAELVGVAREDWRQPVPVVLDLASWNRLAGDLAGWVVEELAAKYQIPRRYGRKWVDADELTLLLDGLDTLPAAARGDCIRAVNEFRVSHGLSGLAVCCRSREYEEAGDCLRLNRAIRMEALDEEALQAYVAHEDRGMDGLATALAANRELRRMARNPLMLNLMTAVFAADEVSRPEEQALAAHSISTTQLFEAYVQRMFERKAAHSDYPRERTEAWLKLLAREMTLHNQNIFLIEGIQPTWLPGKRWRQGYLLLAGSLTGLAGGLIMWLLWRLLRHTLPQLPSPVSASVSALLGISVGAAELLTIMFFNLLLGLLVGATLMVLFERRLGQPANNEEARQMRRRQVVLVGLECGLATLLFILLYSEPLLALAWAVAEGFMYGAAARFIFGWSYATDIETVEAVAWSWQHAATGAAIGLMLAMVAELLESLLYGYNGAMRTVSTLVAAGFVLGGLRGRTTATKNRPNQGVWLSLRNALTAAGAAAVSLFAVAWFVRDFTYAWQVGLLSAVIAAALVGGAVFIKHFLLRAMLRYEKRVPWRYARFLDFAAQLVLLRKVGSGYIFVHGLMQSYFADMH